MCDWYTAKKYLYNEKCIFISITKKSINNFYNYPQLTPDNITYYGHENNILDWCDYKNRYLLGIDNDFLFRFINKLKKYNNNLEKHIIIFNMEYYYKFSYRKILLEFLNEEYNLDIKEIGGSNGKENIEIEDILRFNF